jgi:hypothetical protein
MRPRTALARRICLDNFFLPSQTRSTTNSRPMARSSSGCRIRHEDGSQPRIRGLLRLKLAEVGVLPKFSGRFVKLTGRNRAPAVLQAVGRNGDPFGLGEVWHEAVCARCGYCMGIQYATSRPAVATVISCAIVTDRQGAGDGGRTLHVQVRRDVSVVLMRLGRGAAAGCRSSGRRGGHWRLR